MINEIVPLLILVGPSGSGKTSVITLLNELGAVTKVKSSTTRPIRPEEDHNAYYFCADKSTFFSHNVLEHDKYAGHLYGTTEEAIREATDTNVGFPALAMTYDGAVALSKHFGESVISIFLYATPDEIISRLERRGESKQSIISRLGSSQRELQKVVSNKMNYIDYFIDTTNLTEHDVVNSIVNICLTIISDTRFVRGSRKLFLSASDKLPEEWRF